MGGSDRFATTRWSMVLAAGARGEPGSAEALGRLCEAYWYPLYVFVRRSGCGPEDAADVTQGFFATLVERSALAGVRPEAGKFRSFLLASIKHHLSNTRRDAAALKRGGGVTPLSLDLGGAENRYRHEPVDDRTPEAAYERQWALAVIRRSRGRLRAEFESAGKLDHFRALSGYLSGDTERPYRETAEELGTTEAAVKMSVSRMRRHLGRLLRDEIGDTVADDEQVDAEVRYLLSVVR